MTSGKRASPEFVGVNPWTIWNQRGRKMIAPKNAKAAKNVATIDAAYVRFRNRLSGTIGSFARDSAQTKSTTPTRPARIRTPTCGEAQSYAWCVAGLVNAL